MRQVRLNSHSRIQRDELDEVEVKVFRRTRLTKTWPRDKTYLVTGSVLTGQDLERVSGLCWFLLRLKYIFSSSDKNKKNKNLRNCEISPSLRRCLRLTIPGVLNSENKLYYRNIILFIVIRKHLEKVFLINFLHNYFLLWKITILL